MEKVRCHLLLVIVLVAAVNSQSYPRFEFRGGVLVNNSFILRGAPVHIGEGHNDSLHCVTDNSDCCSNGEGNWYNATGGEVQQGSVVCMSLEEMEWSISTAGQEEVQECGDVIVMVYSRASSSTLALL